MEILLWVLVVLILLLTILYETSAKCRYFTKFSLYYTTGTVAAFILLPIYMVKGRDIRNVMMARCLIYPVTYLLGITWELRGAEHLSKDEAHIIVANHQSSLDLLGMFKMWPHMDKCAAIAKRQLLYVFPFGFGAWYTKTIFIDRDQARSAQNTMNGLAEYIKKERIKLWVFPEGTRNKNNVLLPFKKGAFHVAIDAQLPILPIVFSTYYFLDYKEKKKFDPGTVILTALPPVSTVGLIKDDIDDLIERVRNSMLEVYNRTSKEAQEPAQTTLNNGIKCD